MSLLLLTNLIVILLLKLVKVFWALAGYFAASNVLLCLFYCSLSPVSDDTLQPKPPSIPNAFLVSLMVQLRWSAAAPGHTGRWSLSVIPWSIGSSALSSRETVPAN